VLSRVLSLPPPPPLLANPDPRHVEEWVHVERLHLVIHKPEVLNNPNNPKNPMNPNNPNNPNDPNNNILIGARELRSAHRRRRGGRF
jgi:hypothetical protein